MGEKVQVNIRIGEGQKEDWEEYLEETGEFETLTDLIRTSVFRQINRRDEGPEDSSPALARDIQDLHEELSQVRRDVGWLRRNEQEEVDISEIAQDVLHELVKLPSPSEPIQVPDDVDMDASEYRQQLAAQLVIEPGDADDERSPQRVSDIAERLDVEEKRVEDSIEHLQDQFLPIVEVEYQGELHYFKEE